MSFGSVQRSKGWVLLKIVLGNVLYALIVQLFLLPAGLITGGATGISIAVHGLTGADLSLVLLILNVAMLLVGWWQLGRQFAATTVLSTFLIPGSLWVFERTLGGVVLTQDPMLSAVFAGLGIGVSLGMVIRAGASTGGMDIPPLVLHKYTNVSVPFAIGVLDVLILLLQGFVYKPETVLYGIVLVIISSVSMDRMLLVGQSRTELKIISRRSDEIRAMILERIDRGVTLLDGQTGYTHEPTQIVLSVVSNRELPKVERLVREIDPESFLIISRISEVRGRGFSSEKRYQ